MPFQGIELGFSNQERPCHTNVFNLLTKFFMIFIDTILSSVEWNSASV